MTPVHSERVIVSQSEKRPRSSFLGPLYLMTLYLIFASLRNNDNLDNPELHFWKIALYAGVPVLGAIIYWRIYVLEQKQLKDDAHKAALEGTLKPKNDAPKKPTVTLWLGTNSSSIPTSRIINGYMYRPLLSFGCKVPFLVKVVNGKVLIDAEFRSLDGKYVATIKNNNWQLSAFNHFRKEFDDNKLEVIDTQGITKIQIDFSDEFNIKLSGVLYDRTRLIFVYPNGTVELRPLQPPNKPYKPGYITIQEAMEKSSTMPELFPSIIK